MIGKLATMNDLQLVRINSISSTRVQQPLLETHKQNKKAQEQSNNSNLFVMPYITTRNHYITIVSHDHATNFHQKKLPAYPFHG